MPSGRAVGRTSGTRDGRFKGQKIECGGCAGTYRRSEMVKQRGLLVCKKYCQDKGIYQDRGAAR